MSDYSEDSLVEQPAIQLLAELGWETKNCFYESYGINGTLGRETSGEVVLRAHLLPALRRLNPGIASEALMLATEELVRDRSALSLAQANREVYLLLKSGVKVTVRDEATEEDSQITVHLIDWRNPNRNDFLLVSQLWVSGDMYKRRADLVGFVNGIPFVFIELKAAQKALKNAYDNNLKDYKATIPHLFWYNAVVLLSNGSQSVIGSVTAGWEHFAEWKRINSEGEKGVISLKTLLRGVCDPNRLLDIVENFTLFVEAQGGLVKVLGKNHQVLGVNNALRALNNLEANRGRLGVFWHTQGSGKSISMIFFAQKILRIVPGNWTFFVVTDRQELDTQIYKNFVAAGAVTEKEAQAGSGEDLRRLLREDHRYIFTLIQKFRTAKGATYPKLSDRPDIIVMTDEAHRSQYDTFALNLRNALPNAAFIGFTGTPLIKGEEERTREVFGDYVSVYNFRQSIEDGATVPLYYENRIPELQLVNDDLNADMERLLEAAELDESQESRLEREFTREYHLISRDDRQDTIAQDLVRHFLGRGQRGKAMMVCIDKVNAVRMFDRVRKCWQRELGVLREQAKTATGDDRDRLEEQIRYMEETDMAVVVSQSQNEVADMAEKGLDIVPHRQRMVTEDLEKKFKNENDPLRLVFVCAMWMTGFDVPSCNTLYLDKPMRNHTLMQTIARANRVFPGKVNGLIVDYVGVFRDLQRALSIYGMAAEDTAGDSPVRDKSELVEALRKAIAQTTEFLTARRIDPAAILTAPGFDRIHLLDNAVEAILVGDEEKRRFLALNADVARLYKAILPDPVANQFLPMSVLFGVLAEKINSLTPSADISAILSDVEELLNNSIAAEAYVIRETRTSNGSNLYLDLSQIDFDALRATFANGKKRTEIARLQGALRQKLSQMVRLNRSRIDYLEQFQRMIEAYNADSNNVEQFFQQLLEFTEQLNQEEQRALSEKLTQEELTVFDLLTRPHLDLSPAEEQEVKKVARQLVETLKREKLVLDWRKRQQTRAAVRLTVEEVLEKLPLRFDRDLYQAKCNAVYQHIYDSYYGQGRSIYSTSSPVSEVFSYQSSSKHSPQS